MHHSTLIHFLLLSTFLLESYSMVTKFQIILSLNFTGLTNASLYSEHRTSPPALSNGCCSLSCSNYFGIEKLKQVPGLLFKVISSTLLICLYIFKKLYYLEALYHLPVLSSLSLCHINSYSLPISERFILLPFLCCKSCH